ncbi:MAG: hypothetical protein ACJ79L_11625 [Anaeromyxobacteraceae bacterium]
MTRKSLVAVLLAALTGAPAAARADAAPPPDLSLTDGDLAAPLAQIAGTSDSGTGTIFTSALYGGLAGALVGGAVGLIENGNYGRDIAIGAGAGVLIGAALGAANAFHDTRAFPATDGLNTTEKYPVIQGRTMGLGGKF